MLAMGKEHNVFDQHSDFKFKAISKDDSAVTEITGNN